MANAIICYGNIIDSATLSGGDWSETLPLANLQSRILSKVARSTDAVPASTVIAADFGADRSLGAVALINHNLSSSATVRVRAGSEADMSSGVEYDSTALLAWHAEVPEDDRTAYTPLFVALPPAAINARYMLIEIDDEDNPAGHIDIGRVFAGLRFQPEYNMSLGARLGWVDTDDIQESYSGAIYADEGPQTRQVTVSLDWLSEPEADEVIFELERRSRTTREVIWMWDPAFTGRRAKYWFLGRLRARDPGTYARQLSVAKAIDIVEIPTPRPMMLPPTPDLTGTFYRFDAAGAEEEWIVPPGVTSLRAHLVGASGAAGSYAGATVSGAGGYTVGTIAVTPGQTLKLRVGTRGLKPSVSPYAGGPGGWPGGGSGAGYTGFGDVIGGGGGGYSGIFRADGTPLLIAGGGGGHCAATARNAGAGGGTTGQDADSLTGSGGTQSAGGTSTGVSSNGAYLQGASANGGDAATETAKTGGGGGGGYYGGGAAGTDYADAGGGGGSGYIGGPGVTSAATYAGDGDDPPAERPAEINGETVAPRGNGVPGLYTERGQDGNDGVIWLEVL